MKDVKDKYELNAKTSMTDKMGEYTRKMATLKGDIGGDFSTKGKDMNCEGTMMKLHGSVITMLASVLKLGE